jgi:hypothetical protein
MDELQTSFDYQTFMNAQKPSSVLPEAPPSSKQPNQATIAAAIASMPNKNEKNYSLMNTFNSRPCSSHSIEQQRPIEPPEPAFGSTLKWLVS